MQKSGALVETAGAQYLEGSNVFIMRYSLIVSSVCDTHQEAETALEQGDGLLRRRLESIKSMPNEPKRPGRLDRASRQF